MIDPASRFMWDTSKGETFDRLSVQVTDRIQFLTFWISTEGKTYTGVGRVKGQRRGAFIPADAKVRSNARNPRSREARRSPQLLCFPAVLTHLPRWVRRLLVRAPRQTTRAAWRLEVPIEGPSCGDHGHPPSSRTTTRGARSV